MDKLTDKELLVHKMLVHKEINRRRVAAINFLIATGDLAYYKPPRQKKRRVPRKKMTKEELDKDIDDWMAKRKERSPSPCRT